MNYRDNQFVRKLRFYDLIFKYCLVTSYACNASVDAASKAPSDVPILSMQYVGESNDALSDAYLSHSNSAGLFYDTDLGVLHRVTLMATDWDSSIYVMNPISSGYCYLERFDPKGKLSHTWAPIREGDGLSAAVTKSGYIWVGLRSEIEYFAGLPLVAYQDQSRKPVVDWRYELPKDLMSSINDQLRERHLTWQGGWLLQHMEAGTSQISATFWCPSLDSPHVLLWIKVSDNGAGPEAKLIDTPWGMFSENFEDSVYNDQFTPCLTPGDQVYENLSDSAALPEFGRVAIDPKNLWSRDWYKAISPAIQTVDLIKKGTFATNSAYGLDLASSFPPSVSFDASNHVYLFFSRQFESPTAKFSVNGEDVENDNRGPEAQRSFIVMDSDQKVIDGASWQSLPFKTGASWIKPVPTGAGYYRISYDNDKAVIYYHKF